jgi:hypothetical protein
LTGDQLAKSKGNASLGLVFRRTGGIIIGSVVQTEFFGKQDSYDRFGPAGAFTKKSCRLSGGLIRVEIFSR